MKKTVLAGVFGAIAFASTSSAQVYEVEVLPINDLAVNVFAQAIDENGSVSVATQNLFNQQIDTSLLDFEDDSFVSLLSDPDSAQTGNFNDADYLAIIFALRSATAQNAPFTQKLAQTRSFVDDGISSTEIPAFDVISPTLGSFTQSNPVVLRDSEAGTFFVGTAQGAYDTLSFTTSDGEVNTFVLNDFVNRGFVQLGDTTTALLSPQQTLGGFSEAFAINSALQVAGSGAIAVLESVNNAVNACNDPELRGDAPLEACLWTLNNPAGGGDGQLVPENLLIRPIIWSLDASANVINTEVFGVLNEDNLEEGILGFAEARDINDAGIAVGVSSSTTTTEAVSFNNGQTTRILSDDPDTIASQAVAISNNNVVAGIATRNIDGLGVERMFVTNLSSSEVDLPNGFFVNSVTTPRAINNSDIVVGQAQTNIANDPDLHAFIYDSNTQEFTDLNDLIACDSPFTLINATDINDSGQIAVTARARVPLRNELGVTQVAEDGEAIIVDGAVALRLTPIPNGQPLDCNVDNAAQFEREGATLNVYLLLLLASLVSFRFIKQKGIKNSF